jgi:hypothetical protein
MPSGRAAEGSRVLRRDARRHQEALGRGAGHQALRGGHAPPPQHLRPGRPGEGLGKLGELSLTELIIETGIHDAIARKLNEKGKLSRTPSPKASSTTSARPSSATSSPTPGSTSRCRKLLDDLIKQSRADAAAYEEFLKQGRGAGEAAGRQAAGRGHARGAAWQARGHVIYNNLPRILALRDSRLPLPLSRIAVTGRRLVGARDRPSDARSEHRRAGRATRRGRRRS